MEGQKKAIVMGATSGIGREVALQLAVRGWLVGIAGRRTARLQELCNAHTNIVAYREIDVTSASAPALLAELVEATGGMDLYFHSSGIGWQNESLDMDKELKTVDTNSLGFVRMVGTAFNMFTKASELRGGDLCNFRIACITSIAGTKGLGAAPAYSATKRFQRHYLESLDQLARLRRFPIRITDIRPGFVATDLISGSHYPLQLSAERVARSIVSSVEKGSSVKTIDWRYYALVSLWRLIPRFLWVRLPIAGH